MRNTRVLILMSLFLLSLISLLALIIYSQNQKNIKCPEHWVVDMMPNVETLEPASNNEYFIFNGERKELTDVDYNWIIQNCKIDKEFVY